MNLYFLRNATMLLEINQTLLLVDPMLGAKGSFDPMPWTSDGRANPLVDLPLSGGEVIEMLNMVDAVILTHTHADHWDQAAVNLVPKEKLILVQPADKSKIESQGFLNVVEISDKISWKGIDIHRTGGRHGRGELGEMMGPVSGFVLDNGKSKVYIAGDTVWCPEVKYALRYFRPENMIVNAGGAQFDHGDPITMTTQDIQDVINEKIVERMVIVHLEAINHCRLTRRDVNTFLELHDVKKICVVPDDGEEICLIEPKSDLRKNTQVVSKDME